MTWIRKLNPANSEVNEDDMVANIMNIIDHTKSRTQLALFIKGLKETISNKVSKFNPEEFKKNISLNPKLKIEISDKEINAIKKIIKGKIT